jgi:hypothetical protein
MFLKWTPFPQMHRFNHCSERALTLGDCSLGRFIAAGQRCYCFSSSKSQTSSADQRATGTDMARALTGSGNIQATDQGVAANIGTLSSGNVSATNSTITVGASLGDLSNLVGGLEDSNTQQLRLITTALAGQPANEANPQDTWIKAGAVIGGLALVYNLTRKH